MNAPAEKLTADVRILAADVEELVRATAAETSERIATARNRAQAALLNARDTVVLQGREAVATTDRYVKENTWTAVGVSAAFGFFVGLLVGRR